MSTHTHTQNKMHTLTECCWSTNASHVSQNSKPIGIYFPNKQESPHTSSKKATSIIFKVESNGPSTSESSESVIDLPLKQATPPPTENLFAKNRWLYSNHQSVNVRGDPYRQPEYHDYSNRPEVESFSQLLFSRDMQAFALQDRCYGLTVRVCLFYEYLCRSGKAQYLSALSRVCVHAWRRDHVLHVLPESFVRVIRKATKRQSHNKYRVGIDFVLQSCV